MSLINITFLVVVIIGSHWVSSEVWVHYQLSSQFLNAQSVLFYLNLLIIKRRRMRTTVFQFILQICTVQSIYYIISVWILILFTLNILNLYNVFFCIRTLKVNILRFYYIIASGISQKNTLYSQIFNYGFLNSATIVTTLA